ncbi:hypothetical protein ANO11243_069770 [Dothideomycetidae sp. 11243]|nr:hypothetical protein ANO11243_069770 [fungal sp. No.11243]
MTTTTTTTPVCPTDPTEVSTQTYIGNPDNDNINSIVYTQSVTTYGATISRNNILARTSWPRVSTDMDAAVSACMTYAVNTGGDDTTDFNLWVNGTSSASGYWFCSVWVDQRGNLNETYANGPGDIGCSYLYNGNQSLE